MNLTRESKRNIYVYAQDSLLECELKEVIMDSYQEKKQVFDWLLGKTKEKKLNQKS